MGSLGAIGSSTRTASARLHRRQESAQDIDLVLIQLGPLQKTPDARHEVGAALGAVTEIDLLHHLRQMHIQPVHVLGGRERHSVWS